VRVLGGPGTATLEVEVVRRATQFGDVGGAAVLAIGQLLLLVGLVGWSALAQRRAVAHGGAVVRRRRVATPRDRWVVGIGAALTVAIVAAPLVVLAATSFRPGGSWSLEAWRTLGANEIRPGISLGVDPVASMLASIRTAMGATVLALAIGVTTALAVDAAGRRGRWLDLGMMLPLGTSAVTIGLGMLITFDVAPFDWRDAPWLVPLGHALVAAPFVVRTLLPVLRARPDGWLDAAATLGATPLRAWWSVDVRILRRPAVVAAGLAAAISLGEFGATTFLSRTGEATLPLAIDRLLGRAGDLPRAQGFALATVLMAVTASIVIAVDTLVGRRPDREVRRADRR
jgi:thiamine transport system permease protein